MNNAFDKSNLKSAFIQCNNNEDEMMYEQNMHQEILNSGFINMPEKHFIHVDDWVPAREDIKITTAKDVIIIPVVKFLNGASPELESFNYFRVSKKRSYNQENTRNHIVHYLNYFEKFYDPDEELIAIYCEIKYYIDFEPNYTETAFTNDLIRYIINRASIREKIFDMNADNYIKITRKKTRQDENLQYNNKHSSILMTISMIMKIIIPLITHFAYVNKIEIVPFLMRIYDIILNMFDTDIYSKFYETATSIVYNTVNKNVLWKKQDIRGISPTTHAMDSINQIILNLMPKYEYGGSAIYLNFKSIKENVSRQVLGKEYEYDYNEYSSSKRDAENNSEFDRFESYLAKQDEALYIYNKVNCEETLKSLLLQYGDFSDDEVKFFEKRLLNNNNEFIINKFQKYFIFSLFYKYFGDPVSLNFINKTQWIKLMLLTRKILSQNGLITLAYILTSKITKFVSRNNINKKELTELENSSHFNTTVNKYFTPKIKKEIFSQIATIISSEFEIIDYHNSEIDGKILKPLEDVVKEEIVLFISLI